MKKFILSIIMLVLASIASATNFTDLQFGRYQIADSQWNVGACMYSSSCQIYSTNPGTMYKIPWTSGQWSWQTGQYLQFSATGNGSNPYEGKVYSSNGSYVGTIGTGHIINMGTDSNGYALFFFVGNDNNTGQLFSTNHGFSGTSGYSWTGTLNPTVTQLNTFAATGSTSPLSAGQTYSNSPTVVSTSTTNNVSTTSATSTIHDSTVHKTRARFGNNGQVSNYTDDVRSRTYQTDETTTTTPVTTTTYSDGSSTSVSGSSSSSTTTTYDYQIDITRGNTGTPLFTTFNGNSIYLEEKIGSISNTVTIEQQGPRNTVTGISGTNAIISGQSNNVYIHQGSSSNPNLSQFELYGNNNTVSLNQGYIPGNLPSLSSLNFSDNGGHISYLYILGNTNSLGIQQTNNGGSNSGHYVETTVIGGSNVMSLQQINNGSKELYVDVTGSYNNINVSQKGTGTHYGDINVSGNSNVISLTQDSSSAKYATINATNAGGNSNISVSQTGNTPAAVVVNQICATGTCGLTVTQNK